MTAILLAFSVVAALTLGGCTNPVPAADAPVSELDLTGKVTAPVTGTTPVTTTINADQYVGTIAWQDKDGNAHSGNFAASTGYKAVLTLTAKAGYTFTGVTANSFKYDGAESVTNGANTGTVTITFKATAANTGDGTGDGTDDPPASDTPPASVDEVADYLEDATNNGTTDDPIPLPVQIDLATEWSDLLAAIEDGGKYVALDLSDCTGVTTFDPGTAGTGAEYIVSLVLPNAATGIKAGTSSAPTFKNFTALKSVSGENVQSVDSHAFRGCSGLTSVDLPAATSIGSTAFSFCSGLTSVALPAATSIDSQAFFGCTGLTSVALPAATSIRNQAFADTGDQAIIITLGATVPTLGDRMFYYVNSTKTVTVKVPNNATAWDGKTGTFSGSDNTTENWGNGFRGGGWTNYGGGSFSGNASNINSNISLTVVAE
jgi:hypothetical protein